MEPFLPLIETILWVGLIVWLVLRFHAQIEGLTKALQKRIESGSTVKAGPFQIEDLRPQEPEGQKKKAEEERKEFAATERDSEDKITHKPGREVSQADYLRIEDLALRAIQLDYGKTIQRQVTGGRDPGFDAAFTVDGRLHIVEVKYVRSLNNINLIGKSIKRISDSIEKYHWKNVELIIAIVLENDIDIHDADSKFMRLLENVDIAVKIKPYYLGELENKFGIEG